MPQIKNIIILVLMLLGLGLVAKAQSTPYMPYEGATHSYNVSGLTAGWSYEFFITANADGSNLLYDDLTGEFDYSDSIGTVGGDGLASALISWNNGAASNIYYLWVEVEGGTGCSNKRSVQITPQVNDFDLLTFNDPEDYTESCPSTDAADGFDPLAGADYSPGTTTLKFKVTRENGNRAWSFVPQLTVDVNRGLTNYIIEVRGTVSGEISETGGRYIVNELDDNVIVTVSVENEPGWDRKVTLKAFDGKEDSIDLSDGDNSNDAAVHTIKVMPIINGMGGV